MFDFYYRGSWDASYPCHSVAVKSLSQAQNLCTTRFFWFVTGPSDLLNWDWSWEPPPWQNHARHAWPSQWQLDSGFYLVPKTDWRDTKYHDHPRVQRMPDDTHWQIPYNIDSDSWDRSWHPDYREPAYSYHFGTQWQNTGGPIYQGTQGMKIMDHPRARALPCMGAWSVPPDVDTTSWDFSWHPDPRDPDYQYEFGTTWHDVGGPIYRVVDTDAIKHMPWPRARLRKSSSYWYDVDGMVSEIDMTWRPHPLDPPLIYIFGNQWWSAEKMPTKQYRVPGATVEKYMTEPRAILPPDAQHWRQHHDCEYDQSWVPDPGDPPYRYVFGNQWWPAEVMPTVEYCVPGAIATKFLDFPRCRLLPNRDLWTVPRDIDANAVDCSWCPDPGSPAYIYHFGSDRNITTGVTYTMPGATEMKFAGPIPLLQPDKPAVMPADIFYIDHSNVLSHRRFQLLQDLVPTAIKIRFFNSLLDTLKRCANKSRTPGFWVISSHNDYVDFDFSWRPEIWQRGMIHVFGTQWNKWSETFFIDAAEFQRQMTWQPALEQFYNLNFVTNQSVTAATDATDIVVIDHGNPELGMVIEDLQARSGRVIRTSRYFDNYKDTLLRLLQDVEGEHIWVVSSICDYRTFDFSWQPEAWQRDMLHVFASGDQKFGDTFYAPVRKLRDALLDLALLEWFDTVNYCDHLTVPRWPIPVIRHSDDTHVNVVKNIQWNAPLMLFTVSHAVSKDLPTVSLWSSSTKTIVPLDAGATAVIVPQSAASVINTQLYDYEHIDQNHRNHDTAPLQDVVFISYDEPEAEQNWKKLKTQCARAQRLHGVSGMETALEAAADLCSTPWFFAVFAKTLIDPDFDFTYHPDRMQQPKHYIFNCRNPLNGLEYGHMGVVMYNSEGIRHINRRGTWDLDYTLSFACETVPVLSCHGNFNVTAYHTWRTAFRETAKLAYFESQQHTVENNYRLDTWLGKAEGTYSEWCLRGAHDGYDFFQISGGDLSVLQQSFRWQWLRDRFVSMYGEID